MIVDRAMKFSLKTEARKEGAGLVLNYKELKNAQRQSRAFNRSPHSSFVVWLLRLVQLLMVCA